MTTTLPNLDDIEIELDEKTTLEIMQDYANKYRVTRRRERGIVNLQVRDFLHALQVSEPVKTRYWAYYMIKREI